MRSSFLCLALLLIATVGLRADTKLSDGDMFQMSVSGAPKDYVLEYDLNYTIDDGGISVPNVGRVKAVGLTATQLAANVEKELKDRKIFTNPTVVINVVAVNRTIVVGGAVRNPQRHPWNANMTLSMAIAAASGPADFAEDKVRLIRGGKATEYSRKAIRKDPSLDPKILPNDYVEVTGEY
jgi:protein involved in polysaccharide export with SLBB domain